MSNDNSTVLTMDDLHAATSAEVNAAAAAEERIPSGIYLAKTTAVFPKRMTDDAEYDAGRSLASLAIDLYRLDGTTKVGKTFLKVSWEPRYNKGGRLDNPAKRYTELAKALGSGRTASPADVTTAAKQQMFSIKIRETFKVSSNDLHSSHADAQVGADGEAWVVTPIDEGEEVFEYYTGLGYEARAMVDKVFKAV